MRRVASLAVLAVSCWQATGCEPDLLPSEATEDETSAASTSSEGTGMTSWGGLTGAGSITTSCWSCTSTGAADSTTGSGDPATSAGEIGTESQSEVSGTGGGESTVTDAESTESSSAEDGADETSETSSDTSGESTEEGDGGETSGSDDGDMDSDGAMVEACADLDRDGYGDPDNCSDFAENEVPEDWTVDRAKWTDCDDSDKRTHVGAAEQELTDRCTKDSDNDGYADDDPPRDHPDIVAGSDCNDGSATTHPGAAAHEDDADGCFKDYDGDDWGDADPPTGVDVGRDCDDDEVGIFPGNAKNEGEKDGCFQDEDDDDWGDNDPDNPDVTPGSDCDDDDDKVGECMTEPVVISLANSVGVKPGDSVRLEPRVMGGSGVYTFKWYLYNPDTGTRSPAVGLSDDDVLVPLATPTEPVTHYLLRVSDSDDPDNFDESRIRVYQEETTIDFNTCRNVDLHPMIPDVDEMTMYPPSWEVWDGGNRVCQTTNNQPAAFVCPQEAGEAKISAILQTKEVKDDDWIGFVWGMQSDDDADPGQFYLFHWRREDGIAHLACDSSTDPAAAGMFIRKIDETRTGGALSDCDLLVGTQTGDNSTMLQTPENWTGVGALRGWSVDLEYQLEIEHRSDSSTVTISRINGDDSMTQLATTTVNDSSFPQGKAGPFAFSQNDACVRELRIEALER